MNSTVAPKPRFVNVCAVESVKSRIAALKRDPIALARVRAHHTSLAAVDLVASRIAQNASHQYGDCYPSQYALVEDLPLCLRTIRYAIRASEALGIVDTLTGNPAWAVYEHDPKVRDPRRNAYRVIPYARTLAATRPAVTGRKRSSVQRASDRRDRVAARRRTAALRELQATLRAVGAGERVANVQSGLDGGLLFDPRFVPAPTSPHVAGSGAVLETVAAIQRRVLPVEAVRGKSPEGQGRNAFEAWLLSPRKQEKTNAGETPREVPPTEPDH